MKNPFKEWNLFELLLLFESPIVVLVIGIIFKSDVLTIITSFVGIIGALFVAKGLVLGQFLGLFVVVPYLIISYKTFKQFHKV